MKTNNHDTTPHITKEVQSWKNGISIGMLTILGIFLLGYMVSRYLRNPLYVVVIDVGSTGSHIHAFGFHKSIFNESPTLDSEFYTRIEPGLSSYADDPVEGAEFLQILIDKVKTFIPKSKWQHTPLSLKATAGLRLLPKEKASRLLKECAKLVAKSGFLTSKASVSIMEGTDEGIFFWFTINFLLDRLTSQGHENTVTALDLGGGSTQITFVPDGKHIKGQEEHIYSINALNNNISIYTHSYLGMGLMAARKEILTYGQNVDKHDKNDSPKSLIELHSECINPIISTKWSYGGLDYLVKSPINGTHKVVKTRNFVGVDEGRPVVRFPECLQIVRNYVSTNVKKPLGLENQEIVASSFYFQRATEVGLIDPTTGGIVTVDAFLEQAMVHCDYPNIQHPFMCLDLTFIYVLLQVGYNLPSTTELRLHTKINNHKLSWALGAAFNILQNGL